MSTGYDPKAFENEIYAAWEAGGYFHAEPDPSRQPYVITIPPPNVTGALHLGHALNNTLQDILIRRKRMQGFNACWLPGTDHAGIATQAVVERRLKEEQGLSRHEVGREGLVRKIWEWKEDYNARILNQLRRMGCSCDWQRTRFTLDEQCAKAVYETFFRFFKDGLIYRGLRLVNWDTQLQTAVADDEVYHETVRGNLWHIRYPIVGGQGNNGTRQQGSKGSAGVSPAGVDGVANAGGAGNLPADAVPGRDYLVVATTRPETMLADTAVAVHPDDERYQHLHGGQGAQPTHFVSLPLMNRPIPIVADGMLVKKEFGTGCVKVTPGHDPNDYACYQRKLGQPDEIGIIDLLTPDGKINENGNARVGDVGPASGRSHTQDASDHRRDRPETGPTSSQAGAACAEQGRYAGMKKEDARKKVVADLEALGLLEKIEPYETEIGHSDRSKTPIEPLRSEQWFVKMDKLAETAMEAVRDGRVRFFPERYAKTYLDWLGEKRDWCISRQLWWGHRIPVWTKRMSLAEWSALCDHDVWASMLLGGGQDKSVRVETDGGRSFLISGSDHDYESALVMRDSIPRSAALTWRVCLRDSAMTWAVEARPEDKNWAPPRQQIITAKDWLERTGFEQDPDVLDTWFSSALWPHSTFGWPVEQAQRHEGTKAQREQKDAASSPSVPSCVRASVPSDLDYFYPTSVLSTAREIITLWVARMVMTGLYNVGRVPFQHVYIHAVIQDGHGRRMSKSAGNGVDPLDIIDAYGSDALRFTLAQLATETQDIRIPVKPMQLPDGRTVNTSERFELGRNLVTKLWQAATGFVIPTCKDVRIRMPNAECRMQKPAAGAGRLSPSTFHLSPELLHTARRPSEMPLFEKWIRVKLLACIREVDQRIDNYEFSAAVDAIRTFFWNDLCDWYIEEVKSHLRDAGADEDEKNDVKITLLQVFDIVLCLFHPAIPYVTEAVWAEIGREVPRHHELIWPENTTGPSPKRERAGVEADGAGCSIRSSQVADRSDEYPRAGAWGSDCPAKAPMLIAMPWPKAAKDRQMSSADAGWLAEVVGQTAAEREVDAFLAVIRGLREIRTSLNAIRSQAKQPALRNLPAAVIRCDAATAALLREGEATITRLGQVEKADAAKPDCGLTISPDAPKPPQSMSRVLTVACADPGERTATVRARSASEGAASSTIEIFVPIAGLADIEIERKRLGKERDEAAAALQRLDAKLANQGFVAKAKPEVIEAERARQSELKEKLAAIERNLAELG